MSEQMSGQLLLRAEKLRKVYWSGGISHVAVDCVSLHIEKGDFLSIVGASGSGKSTLMYLLAGMVKPNGGRLFLESQTLAIEPNVPKGHIAPKGCIGIQPLRHTQSQSVWDMTEKQRAEYRGREIGFVYQDSRLIHDMNILCNVSLPGYLYEPRRAVERRSSLWLQYLGLASLKNKFPEELSGGEKQKAAIARALINKPRLLLLDEPTGSLDFASGERILDLLLSLNAKGQSIAMVTHDLRAAAKGSQVLFIRDGQVCQTLELGKYEHGKKAERESAIYQMMKGGVKEA